MGLANCRMGCRLDDAPWSPRAIHHWAAACVLSVSHFPARIMSKLTVLSAVLLCASCVTQSKYDEALETAQMYQRAAHDNAEYIAQLESRLNNMEAMPMPSADTIDASYAADIDERLANLRNMLAGIGHDDDRRGGV